MDYNNTLITIGKIKNYNCSTGEIVSKEGIYIFTQDNIAEGEELATNDMVLFRGEQVKDVKVAYFIKKLSPEKNLEEQIYTKTKSRKFLKEND